LKVIPHKLRSTSQVLKYQSEIGRVKFMFVVSDRRRVAQVVALADGDRSAQDEEQAGRRRAARHETLVRCESFDFAEAAHALDVGRAEMREHLAAPLQRLAGASSDMASGAGSDETGDRAAPSPNKGAVAVQPFSVAATTTGTS
jgi:hypothetical protein